MASAKIVGTFARLNVGTSGERQDAPSGEKTKSRGERPFDYAQGKERRAGPFDFAPLEACPACGRQAAGDKLGAAIQANGDPSRRVNEWPGNLKQIPHPHPQKTRLGSG